MFQTKVADKIKTRILCSVTFFRQSCCLWDNVKNIVKPGWPQMKIWRIRIACWIPKSSNTRSEYVILIAFTLHELLRESAPMLPLYVHTLPQLSLFRQ